MPPHVAVPVELLIPVTRSAAERWMKKVFCSAKRAANVVPPPATAPISPSPPPAWLHGAAAGAAPQFGRRLAALVMSPGNALYMSLNDEVAASIDFTCATCAVTLALVISCCPFRT